MITGTLLHFETSFSSVGWFIPPYTALGLLSDMAAEILHKGNRFSQVNLEERLAHLYGADRLAAMVCSRNLTSPVVAEYKETIAESIEAHFIGLHHVAVESSVRYLGIGVKDKRKAVTVRKSIAS